MSADPLPPEDHTGENIAAALRETLESWEIDVSNQVCLTTDNGSNTQYVLLKAVWAGLISLALATISTLQFKIPPLVSISWNFVELRVFTLAIINSFTA